MRKFGLRKIEVLKGKQDFFDLVINQTGQFDAFTEQIKKEGRYLPELLSIMAYMELVAALKLLPQTKFKEISLRNEHFKEYEFKSKHLRVYVFHLEHIGKVIVTAGFKNSQPADIRKFRMLKKEFLNHWS